MKTFSLKRVLELRTNREERAAAALARANHDVDQASALQDTAQHARHTGETQIAAAALGGATVGELRALSLVLASVDARLDDARIAVDAAHTIAEQAQAQHQLASREKRVLDKLYERHLESVRLQAVAQDRQAMDAAALARFTHGDAAAAAGGERR